MKQWIERLSPPGMKLRTERIVFWAGNGGATLWMLLGFLTRYARARGSLYVFTDGKRRLIEGAVLPSFWELMSLYPRGFFLVGVMLLSFVVWRYAYFRQGSRSDYLMRRLPRPGLRHKMAWCVPLWRVAVTAVLCLACGLLCLAVYLWATPEGCLPQDGWRNL